LSYTFFDCETVRRRLPERGELTGEARHGLEEHLSSCAACAAEAARLARPNDLGGLAPVGKSGDEALQDALARAARLEISPWFQEKLHRDIMAAVDDLAPPKRPSSEALRRTGSAAASVLRPTFFALKVAAIFAIFSLAILFFLWNPISLNKHAPEAALMPQQAAVLPAEGVPLNAGTENAEPPAGRALAPRKVSGEEMTASSEGEAALLEKVGVTVRFERDATVLEWAGPRDARYRVTRSFRPDFETASYLEFIEVEGLRYRDLDARPGTRFYRVERIG
jgi:anti-sigma factor RsiW